MMDLIDLAERAVLPDWLIRLGMRRLLASRLAEERRREETQPGGALRQFVQESRRSPIAVHTDAANVQHYEVPTEFSEPQVAAWDGVVPVPGPDLPIGGSLVVVGGVSAAGRFPARGRGYCGLGGGTHPAASATRARGRVGRRRGCSSAPGRRGG